ncbi:zinc-dependent peptidase [Marinicella sp. S1101]|uniref:M90 family metallopeptidase n=1 Tax=Marinicella marina TaxID=2996016 RepID=UPI002260A7D4|nr:M90 family metallopeptidase [Marinicella marina]MCX7553813.1 zinc-dependent peptidase [Marinicella marina]MDJ1140889.1 zinc-dependent peptidase [Marinicella marina]
MFYWIRNRRLKKRQKIYKLPTPGPWVDYIKNNVAIYHFLPQPLQQELLGHVNVFLAEKYFSGHAGLEVTDEMRVTIAAQACLLLLNRKTNYYPHLKTIMIYPAGFKNPNHHDKPGHHLGESWVRGPVILSWNDSIHGARNAKDGTNVVIHEFAHQLDQADGAGDGRPWFDSAHIKTWGKVMSKEFKSLIIKAKLNKRSFLDHYGATNPAEFFAVSSEHFFEQPKTFKRKHPELYQILSGYYRLDPSSWLIK